MIPRDLHLIGFFLDPWNHNRWHFCADTYINVRAQTLLIHIWRWSIERVIHFFFYSEKGEKYEISIKFLTFRRYIQRVGQKKDFQPRLFYDWPTDWLVRKVRKKRSVSLPKGIYGCDKFDRFRPPLIFISAQISTSYKINGIVFLSRSYLLHFTARSSLIKIEGQISFIFRWTRSRISNSLVERRVIADIWPSLGTIAPLQRPGCIARIFVDGRNFIPSASLWFSAFGIYKRERISLPCRTWPRVPTALLRRRRVACS